MCRAVLLAGFVVGVSGCATTDQINELRSMVEQAQATAAEAQRAAGDAAVAAAQAQSTADQALSAANDANDCCAANTERLNRMWDRLMMK